MWIFDKIIGFPLLKDSQRVINPIIFGAREIVTVTASDSAVSLSFIVAGKFSRFFFYRLVHLVRILRVTCLPFSMHFW